MSNTPEDSAKSLTDLVVVEIRVQMARANNMRQSQLARLIGKNEQWLSDRLRGRVLMDLEDLNLIAEGLGVNVLDLLPPGFPTLPAAALRPNPTSPRPRPRPRPRTHTHV